MIMQEISIYGLAIPDVFMVLHYPIFNLNT